MLVRERDHPLRAAGERDGALKATLARGVERGVDSVGDTFGAARSDVSGGWHHGDDIFAPYGTPVLAVAHGVVFSVGWDGVGGWRERDGEFKIDASGVLPGGEQFTGPAELRRVLMGKADLFRRNIAEKMLTFALGRGLDYTDKCSVDEITRQLVRGNDRFSALMIGIVTSDPFQKRRSASSD